jgi:hypothetical protein
MTGSKSDDRKHSERLLTKIERALRDAGVSEQYIKALAKRKTKVALQPVFMRGFMEYAVFVDGFPDHVLGLFRNRNVARMFIKIFELELVYDGAF